MMDFIKGLDLDLEKDSYYPGETINGHVLLSCIANVKIRGIVVTLRGRVQVQWKIVKNGAVYTVRNCQFLLDQKHTVWGQDISEFSTDLPILKKGTHKIRISFKLPETDLPSSFESKLGTIRYFLHTCVDIPYASPPQCVRNFTLIGKACDSPPQEWLVPISLERQNQNRCMACSHGPLAFSLALSRTAFCCGENIPLQLEINNGVNLKVWPVIQLIQKVDYFVDKTGFGVKKDAMHVVWQYKGPAVPKHSTMKLDNLSQVLQVPVMPPTTTTDLCDIIQIEYKLKVSLTTLKWGEPLHVTIPILITPYYPREDNTSKTILKQAISTVEGGNYISPELKAGAVYDGTVGEAEEVILYQPTYICIPHKRIVMKTPSTPEVVQKSPAAGRSSPATSCSLYASRTVAQSSYSQIELSETKVSSL